MTIGLILGTSLEEKAVYEKAEKANFIINSTDQLCLYHKFIPQLRLQVHNPCYLLEYSNSIKTEIEFDDCSDTFPDSLRIIEALKILYSQIPDLIYLSDEMITRMYHEEKVIPEKLLIFLSKF